MNEQRIKNLRKSLNPLWKARAILGNVLGGDGDDDKLKDALISTDYVIDHVELATGWRRRSKPQPFDPAVPRRTGVKELTTDQRTNCSRDALGLLREARFFILAARKAAGEFLEHASEAEIEVNKEAVLNTYDHASGAERRIADVIEGVRALMGLPPDPLMVLSDYDFPGQLPGFDPEYPGDLPACFFPDPDPDPETVTGQVKGLWVVQASICPCCDNIKVSITGREEARSGIYTGNRSVTLASDDWRPLITEAVTEMQRRTGRPLSINCTQTYDVPRRADLTLDDLEALDDLVGNFEYAEIAEEATDILSELANAPMPPQVH